MGVTLPRAPASILSGHPGPEPGSENHTMRRIAFLAAVSVMLASMSVAGAPTKSGAETGLLGIHLYDSGTKIVNVFGTPNEIQAVSIGGGGGVGGGAGAGRGPGVPGAPPGPGGRPGG